MGDVGFISGRILTDLTINHISIIQNNNCEDRYQSKNVDAVLTTVSIIVQYFFNVNVKLPAWTIKYKHHLYGYYHKKIPFMDNGMPDE